MGIKGVMIEVQCTIIIEDMSLISPYQTSFMKNLSSVIIFLLFATLNAAAQLGPKVICMGATITWTGSVSGGTWASSNTSVATIGSSSGVITGVSAGSSHITYYHPGGFFESDTIFVKPLPSLTSSLTPPAICDSALFTYAPTSSIGGTTFSWSRAYVPGILALAGTGTGSVSERLDNGTSFPRPVTYIYTLTADGCSTTQTVTVTVNPTPILSSPLSIPFCSGSGAIFNYTPASYVLGTTFVWSRALASGISNPPAAGTGGISEALVGSGSVIYVYTLTANGCSHTQNVTINVEPKPYMVPPFTATTCSGIPFHFAPGIVGGVTAIYWSCSPPPGIIISSGFGAGDIDVTLVNTTSLPVDVPFHYGFGGGTCDNTQSITVTVDTCGITAVKEHPILQVNIYPNPGKGVFSIYIPSAFAEVATITITTVDGKKIQEVKTRTNSNCTLKLDAARGVYLLTAKTQHEVFSCRIVVND
jgi:hypothetical protein